VQELFMALKKSRIIGKKIIKMIKQFTHGLGYLVFAFLVILLSTYHQTAFSQAATVPNVVNDIFDKPYQIETVESLFWTQPSDHTYWPKYDVKTSNNNLFASGDPSTASKNLFFNAQRIENSDEPTITSFSPISATQGTSIVITGTGFTGATSVTFGGVNSFSFTVVNDTQITATVAYGTSGDVVVSTPTANLTKSGFIFIPSTIYDFNYLPVGSIEGVDGWRTVPTGSSGPGNTHQVLVPGVTSASQNSTVTGHDGTRAIRFPFGGANIGARATRINNANFSTLAIANDEGIYVVEFEMQHPCWVGGFALGYDANADGDIAENTEVGIRLNISNCGGVIRNLVLPNGSSVNGTYVVGSFNKYQIVIDRAANAGAGAISVYIKNLTASSNWEPIAGLQKINAGFDTGSGKANPANWNAMMFRSESWDPSSLLDNISFRKVIPSTKSIAFANTPVGGFTSESLTLAGVNLNGNLTATLTGDFEFSDGATIATGLTDGTLNTIRFKPQAEGLRTGTLVLQGDDMQVPFSIPLSGTGFPVNLTINSGDGQSAKNGSNVAIPPSIMVKDVDNNPIAGVSVLFSVVDQNQVLASYPFTSNRLPDDFDNELIQAPGEISLSNLSWGFITDGNLGYGPTLHVTSQSATTKDAAIAANSYFSFTLNAKTGESFNLDFLRFQVGRGIHNVTSGLRGYAIRSSLDNYNTDLFTEETPDGTAAGLSQKQVNLSGFEGLSSITFRVYVYTPSGGESLNFLNWQFGTIDPNIVTGTVNPVTAVISDALGIAAVNSWTLASSAGVNKLRASVVGLSPVTFTATGLELPSAPRLYTESASVALRTDNDFAVFLGDENNVTSLFYQNNVRWNDQITEAATLEVLASSGESYIYVVAMGGGGTEDFGGTLNEQDVTLVAGAQRAISRATPPSTVEDGYLLVQGFLTNYNSSLSSVENGTYNVSFADLQTALAGASWGPAVSTGVGSGIPPNHKTTGVSALLTGRAWGFPSESAVVFRYPFPTIFSLAPELQPVPDYDGGQIFFKEPADEGGSPIVRYVVEYRIAGSAGAWATATASACTSGIQPCMDITGLDSGVTYEFRVAAENADGVGPFNNPIQMTTLEAHVWNGTLSTLGENDSNWSIALPPANAKIIIPSSATHFPEFDFDYLAGDLEIETGATLTMAPGRVLRFGAGKSATGNGRIILRSDASGDASIGDLTGTDSLKIMVVQERYVAEGNRAFRFLAHPYDGDIPISVLSSTIDITGPGGAANGFTTTATNAPSVFRFNPATADGGNGEDSGWQAFTNANQIWKKHEGIRVLIRGAKGQANSLLDTDYNPDPVVLEWEGRINQGDQAISLVGANISGDLSDWNLVGNPFPSAIDLRKITHSDNTVTSFAVWQPRAAFVPAPGTTVNLIPGAGRGGGYLTEPILGAPPTTDPFVLPAGASFFIRAGSTTATLSIPESAKIAAPPSAFAAVLRKNNEGSKYGSNSLQLQLSVDGVFIDRILLFMNERSSPVLEKDDAAKMANPAINFFTVSEDDYALAIDRRPYTEQEGINRIPLHILAPAFKGYTLTLPDFHLEEGRTVRLYDRFTDEIHHPRQRCKQITFSNVTADPKSKGHRFDIVMGVEVITSLETVSNRFQAFLLPNPAQEQVRISIQRPDNLADTYIRLVSMTGVVVRNEKLTADTSELDINLTELSKGIYLVEITHGTERIVKRLIVN
jgi:hypothetical protein